MAILTSELLDFAAANRPDNDDDASGGAIDLTHRHDIVQLTSDAALAAVSDGADTRTLTVVGRLPNGVADTEVLTLNGTTEVVGLKTFTTILSLTLSGADAARTVTVTQGSGGATRATFAPNDVSKSIFFINSASAAGAVDRYQKFFWKNTNATLALLTAQVTLTADPESRIMMALDAAKNGTAGEANRLTPPTGLSFVDDGVAQDVPGGFLDADEAIGVWIEQALEASDTARRSSFTTQLSGSST